MSKALLLFISPVNTYHKEGPYYISVKSTITPNFKIDALSETWQQPKDLVLSKWQASTAIIKNDSPDNPQLRLSGLVVVNFSARLTEFMFTLTNSALKGSCSETGSGRG